MLLHVGPVGDGPAIELAIAHSLVRLASTGEITEALRIYRPEDSVAVFGRRDTLLPGFPAAKMAAARAGFRPLVRATGGRAVAYTQEAIVVDHVMHDPEAVNTHVRRFQQFGVGLAELFRSLGVPAQVGAVPGEYCPGAHSVNARGTVKLAGTAQRIVKNAWLFSSLIVIGDEARLRPVLSEIYECLGQPFDPDSVGSLTGEAPWLDTGIVESALIEAHGMRDSEAEPVQPRTLALARDLINRHNY